MAANEHKNLSDINRHNPKGFETATNDSILGKNIGTGAGNTDGNLEWILKSQLKTTAVSMKGYSTGNGSTYEYAQNLTDGQAPFEHNFDYGSGTVGGATLDVSNIFRAGGYVAHSNCTINKIRGWMVGSTSNSNTATIAICKVTPVEDDASELTPVLLDEVTITPKGNDKLFNINETSFTNDNLTEGDIVFAMIKSSTTGMTIFFNLTIELKYNN